MNIRDAALAALLALLVWKLCWDKEQHSMAVTTGAQVKSLRPHVSGVTIRLWLCRGLWDTQSSHHNNVSSDTSYQTAFWGTTIICLLALAMLIFITNMEWMWIIYMNIKCVLFMCVLLEVFWIYFKISIASSCLNAFQKNPVIIFVILCKPNPSMQRNS